MATKYAVFEIKADNAPEDMDTISACIFFGYVADFMKTHGHELVCFRVSDKPIIKELEEQTK